MKKTLTLVLALVLCLCVMAPALAVDYSILEDLDVEAVQKAIEWTNSLDTTGKTYDEKVTIQRATEFLSDSKDYITGDFQTLWWQDHFNFEWDLITLPSSGTNDRARTLINSGDMPDILDWTNYDTNEIASYIDQGLFKELPSDWKERWPNLAATQPYCPIAAPFAERVGGDYTLFRVTFFNNYPGEVVVNHDTVYLRKDWAEAVGFELKEAYSIEEVLEFARLVKEKDPGQIGDRLIPIIANTEYLRYMFMRVNHPTFDDIYKKDGKYTWGFADQETLELLKVWKQAYKDGLIAPEFYTYEVEDAINTFSVMGNCGVLFAAGSAGTVSDIIEGLHGEEYPEEISKMHVAAIVGNDGNYHGDESVNYWGATYFSADIDDAVFERYMDMLEFHCSVDWQFVKTNGFRYLDWDYDENGEIYALDPDGLHETQLSGWPLYHLLAVCGDDGNLNPITLDKGDKMCVPYTMSVYNAKLNRIVEDSIAKIDMDAYTLNSEKQAMMTNVNLDSIIANLIVSDGDLETEWKAAIAENAYIVEPAVEELNELFCK